jgi:hypothetical protein
MFNASFIQIRNNNKGLFRRTKLYLSHCPTTFSVQSPTPRRVYILGCDAMSSSRTSSTFRNNVLPPSSVWSLTCLTHWPWTWRQYVPPKHLWAATGLQDATWQNMLISSHYSENLKYNLDENCWFILKIKCGQTGTNVSLHKYAS